MKGFKILGLDPGFANVGFAVYRVELAQGTQPERQVVERAGLIWTEKSDKKRNVLAVDDNTRRTREISKALASLISSNDIQAICAEAMSFPRHASNAAKMAMTWGVIISLAEGRRIPIVQPSPQEIKLALCKRKDASKQDIREAIEAKFGMELASKMADHNGLKLTAKADFDHPFDAIASVLTGLESEVLRMARKTAA